MEKEIEFLKLFGFAISDTTDGFNYYVKNNLGDSVGVIISDYNYIKNRDSYEVRIDCDYMKYNSGYMHDDMYEHKFKLKSPVSDEWFTIELNPRKILIKNEEEKIIELIVKENSLKVQIVSQDENSKDIESIGYTFYKNIVRESEYLYNKKRIFNSGYEDEENYKIINDITLNRVLLLQQYQNKEEFKYTTPCELNYSYENAVEEHTKEVILLNKISKLIAKMFPYIKKDLILELGNQMKKSESDHLINLFCTIYNPSLIYTDFSSSIENESTITDGYMESILADPNKVYVKSLNI